LAPFERATWHQRRPVTGDRKRQEASAFTWALVTQGETRFAPRPIEASRPEPVRREWADCHSSTQWKLASSDRIHYAGLRKLLIEHASHLAGHIDQGNVPESPGG
jgi:hypothetical protein